MLPVDRASTGYTPFRLTTGRDAIHPVTLHETTHVTRYDVKTFLQDYDDALVAARERVAEAKVHAALHPPTPRRPHDFQPGDLVLLSTEHLSCRTHKYSKPWVGPFPVLAVHGNALELDLSSHPTLRAVSPKWNVASIKRYYTSPKRTTVMTADIPAPCAPRLPSATTPPQLPLPHNAPFTHTSPLAPCERPAFAPPAVSPSVSPSPTPRANDLPSGTPSDDHTQFVATHRDPATHALWYRYHRGGTDPTTDVWVTAHDARTDPNYAAAYQAYNQRCRHERLLSRDLSRAHGLRGSLVSRRAIVWLA